MPVDEAARHQLYNALESTLGPEPTSTLMSLLPPVGWADVATKQDLSILENGLRAEMSDLRGELRSEIANLRGELRVQGANLRAGMHRQTRDLTFRLIAAMFSLAGITWAAVTFGG